MGAPAPRLPERWGGLTNPPACAPGVPLSGLGTCPCCNQPIEREAIFIDCNSNTLAVGWSRETAKLPRQGRLMLELLACKMPARVSRDALITHIWDGRDEPDDAEQAVRTLACQMRRIIAPLGLRIDGLWGEGYRLVRAERPRPSQ
jgi:DNA-binding response OmpR family regulator